MRPVLLLIAAAAVLAIFRLPTQRDASNVPNAELETIALNFALCSAPGYARNCVTDGDTFRLGRRRIRVVGIDTAERNARCEAEARLARRATLALQDWLNRGTFTMAAQQGNTIDRYGRDLRTIWRDGANGERELLTTFMRETAGARPYMGGARQGWC